MSRQRSCFISPTNPRAGASGARTAAAPQNLEISGMAVDRFLGHRHSAVLIAAAAAAVLITAVGTIVMCPCLLNESRALHSPSDPLMSTR